MATLNLWSADNPYKQFEPRSSAIKYSLDPDLVQLNIVWTQIQAQLNVGPQVWIQNLWDSDGTLVPELFF